MKRVKRRYLALQLECDVLPTEREFIDAVWLAITRLYGEVGASTSGLSMINFDLEQRIAVIRVSLAALCMVRSSLATGYKFSREDCFGACFRCFGYS